MSKQGARNDVRLGKNERLPSRDMIISLYEEMQAAGEPVPAPQPETFKAWVKSSSEQSLFFFSKWIFSRFAFPDSYNKFGDFHREICAWLTNFETGHHKLLMLPVGHWKTTLVSHAMPLHILIQGTSNSYFTTSYTGGSGPNSRIVLGAENQRKASENLLLVREHLEANPWLVWLWPQIIWDNINDAPRWTAEDFTVPRQQGRYREPSVCAYGVENAITGGHFDAILPDDIATIRAGQSAIVMDTVKTWLKRSFTRLHDRFQSIHLGIGTHQGTDDVYLEWEQRPGIETLKRAIEEKDESGVLRPIWPEEWSPAKIEKLKQETDAITLSLWYFNRPVATGYTALDWDTLREFRWIGEHALNGFKVPEALEFEETETDDELLRVRESVKNPLARFANGLPPLPVQGNRERMVRRFFNQSMPTEMIEHLKMKYSHSPAETPEKATLEGLLGARRPDKSV